MKMKERPQLQDWFNNNQPPDDMCYKNAAIDQFIWVRDPFTYMVWNALLPKHLSYDDRCEMVTVDGTHTSKSIVLPVYRFDVGGVKMKIRGNFHDWCLRCWADMKTPFPEWMKVHEMHGYYEGMANEDSPITFCVGRREKLYAIVWWMLNEI